MSDDANRGPGKPVGKPAKKLVSTGKSALKLALKSAPKPAPKPATRPVLRDVSAPKPTPISTAWKGMLVKGGKDGTTTLACSANVALIFTHDPAWKDLLQYNEFVGDIVATRPPPWPKDIAPAVQEDEWSDKDVLRSAIWLARRYGLACPTHVVAEGLHVVADRLVMHPVRDWLKGLKWDRKKRIDDFLIRLAGAKDNPYTCAVSSKFLIGAVARIFDPGCQVDSMPVFEGVQGSGKTSLLRILGGKWFMSTAVTPGSLDSYQVLRGMWIVEFGELDSLSRSEVSSIKQYITQTIDRYRPSYARKAANFKRRVVFTGTINPEGDGTYLKDNTGNRRFWPIALGTIDLAGVKKERDQLWAEAVHRYHQNEAWHFTDAALIKAAADEAEDRRQGDTWEEIVGLWLWSSSEKQRAEGVTTREVLMKGLGFEAKAITRGDLMRVSTVLARLNWPSAGKVWLATAAVRVYRPTLRWQEERAKSKDKLHLVPAAAGKAGKTKKP